MGEGEGEGEGRVRVRVSAPALDGAPREDLAVLLDDLSLVVDEHERVVRVLARVLLCGGLRSGLGLGLGSVGRGCLRGAPRAALR